MRLAALLCCCITLTACGTSSTSISTVMRPASPTAESGGPYTGKAGAAISFNGSQSSDPQNQALSYAWNFGDGTSATGVTPSHTYIAAGAYAVTLTVTDTSNLSNSASTTATIASSLLPPAANAGGPYTGSAGVTITFNGAASTDPQNEPLTYAWNFGDFTTGAGATPTHTYSVASTYPVTLTVTDTSSLSGSASTTAAIGPAPPKAPTANPGGPYVGTAGYAVSFDGSGSSDPQGQSLTYTWTFGDGGMGTGVAPTHTYVSGGTYTVTLTVTDTSHLSGTASVTATMAPPLPPPTAATRIYQTTATEVSPGVWSSTLVVYPARVSGAVVPTLTLTSPNTTDIYQSIGVDPWGNVYIGVNNVQTNGLVEILEVAPPTASGVVTPIRTISGPATQLGNIGQSVVDSFGNLYIVSVALTQANILEFAAGASGNVAPIRTITVLDDTAGSRSVFFGVDPAENVVVGFPGNALSSIQVFTASQSGIATPARTISLPDVTETISGMALDATGNIYAAAELTNGAGVLEFVGGANPSASNTPINTINTGLSPLVADGGGFELDGIGTIYGNQSYGSGFTDTVNWISTGSSGTVVPLVETLSTQSFDVAVH